MKFVEKLIQYQGQASIDVSEPHDLKHKETYHLFRTMTPVKLLKTLQNITNLYSFIS